MGFLGQISIVFLCIMGGSYALWLICDCCRRRQATGDGGTTAVRRGGYAGRFDWFLELLAAATFLIVAAALLVMSAHDHSSDSIESSASVSSARIPGMCEVPSRRLEYDNEHTDRPIVGADLCDLPITDDDLRVFLDHAPEIRWINLNSTKITNACLADLKHAPGLVELCVKHTSITDLGLQHVAQCQNLRVLSLAGTRITDAGLEALWGLDSLRELDLQNTRVTDAGLESIWRIPGLEVLSTGGTDVTPRGIRDLRENQPCLTHIGDSCTTYGDGSGG